MEWYDLGEVMDTDVPLRLECRGRLSGSKAFSLFGHEHHTGLHYF